MKISKDAQSVVYRNINGVIEFLLLKRFDKDKDRSDYRLIKGGIKNNEAPEEAAIREVFEESGLAKIVLKNKLDEYSYQIGDIKHEVEVFLIENTEIEDIKTNSENEGGFIIEKAEWILPEKAISCLVFEQEKKSIQKSLDLI